jgi:hypothetical protein
VLLVELRSEWSGESYSVIDRNCNDFAAAFAQRLGVHEHEEQRGRQQQEAGAAAAVLGGAREGGREGGPPADTAAAAELLVPRWVNRAARCGRRLLPLPQPQPAATLTTPLAAVGQPLSPTTRLDQPLGT